MNKRDRKKQLALARMERWKKMTEEERKEHGRNLALKRWKKQENTEE